MRIQSLTFAALMAAGMPLAWADSTSSPPQPNFPGITVVQAPPTSRSDTERMDKPTPKEPQATGKEKSGAGLSRVDKNFVEEATEGGAKEVQLGQLASEKASSDQVKKFGKHMVEDHSKANSELMQIVRGKDVHVKGEAEMKEKRAAEKLRNASGAEFDRKYMQQMVKDHEKTVKLFEKEAKDGKDPQLKAFAEKQLPTLREHLKMARNLADQVGAGGGEKAAAGKEGSGAGARKGQ